MAASSRIPADPGQVQPGTQNPIETIFVVSRSESEPNVGEYTPCGLADLFRGTDLQRVGSIAAEYALFTDRTSADNYAKRQRLLQTAIGYLKRMGTEQLEEIAPALAPAKVWWRFRRQPGLAD